MDWDALDWSEWVLMAFGVLFLLSALDVKVPFWKDPRDRTKGPGD